MTATEPERRPRGRGLPAVPRVLLWLVGVSIGAFIAGYAITSLLFASGPAGDIATVPDLRGRTERAAARQLDRAGLDLERGSRLPNPTVPEGAVVAQTPLPGQEVAPGTAVQVILSSGPERQSVPEVGSLSGSQAAALLRRSGFQVQVRETFSSRGRGSVVEVRPAAGTQLTVPGRVELVVSAGPPPVPAPDLAGLSQQEAQDVLGRVGLRVGNLDYDPLAPQPIGVVVGQRPAAGDNLAAGTKVDLTVSGLPPRIETGPALLQIN